MCIHKQWSLFCSLPNLCHQYWFCLIKAVQLKPLNSGTPWLGQSDLTSRWQCTLCSMLFDLKQDEHSSWDGNSLQRIFVPLDWNTCICLKRVTALTKCGLYCVWVTTPYNKQAWTANAGCHDSVTGCLSEEKKGPASGQARGNEKEK